MNDKLDDLMYQAGLTAQGCWDQMDKYDRTSVLKFAELIIQECAEFSRNYNLEKAERSYMIHKAIKEHFGVDQ